MNDAGEKLTTLKGPDPASRSAPASVPYESVAAMTRGFMITICDTASPNVGLRHREHDGDSRPVDDIDRGDRRWGAERRADLLVGAGVAQGMIFEE